MFILKYSFYFFCVIMSLTTKTAARAAQAAGIQRYDHELDELDAGVDVSSSSTIPISYCFNISLASLEWPVSSKPSDESSPAFSTRMDLPPGCRMYHRFMGMGIGLNIYISINILQNSFSREIYYKQIQYMLGNLVMAMNQ